MAKRRRKSPDDQQFALIEGTFGARPAPPVDLRRLHAASAAVTP
jgi:hypothetical protein